MCARAQHGCALAFCVNGRAYGHGHGHDRAYDHGCAYGHLKPLQPLAETLHDDDEQLLHQQLA